MILSSKHSRQQSFSHAVELGLSFADRLCGGAAASKNNCICVYATTTSDMYVYIPTPDSEGSLQVENVMSVCFNSHTWSFGVGIQNMVGIYFSVRLMR